MRILFFVENIAKGGVDTFIKTLIQNWPDKNDDFKIIANFDHPGWSNLQTTLQDSASFRTYNGLFPRNISSYRSSSLTKKIWWKIISYYCLMRHIFNIKYLLKNEKYDVLFVINGGYPGGESCRAATIVGKNVFTNIHNFAATIPLPFYPIEKLLDTIVTKRSKAIITVSNSCCKSLSTRLDSQNLSFIYNGITQDDHSKISEKNCTTEIHCSIVGSFSERKGQVEFLNVIKNVAQGTNSIVFHFYGENEESGSNYKNMFIEKVYQLELESIIITHGFTPTDEIYRTTDILCVPSQSHESFGLVCVEAMSRGIPVIATNVGGLPEVVTHNSTGFIVDRNDFKQFALYIAELASFPQKRASMGLQGTERFKKNFTAARMCIDYHQKIHSLVTTTF